MSLQNDPGMGGAGAGTQTGQLPVGDNVPTAVNEDMDEDSGDEAE